MGRIHAEGAAVIDARPEEIYELIADYDKGHRYIVPPDVFKNLKVEQGGRGEGTIITFDTVAMGIVRHFRDIVTEPEPGHILVESSPDGNKVTRFIVTPQADGQGTHVLISTDMNVRDGFVGWLEKALTVSFLRNTYKKELRLIAAVAKERSLLVAEK
jgi:hypothetical protein